MRLLFSVLFTVIKNVHRRQCGLYCATMAEDTSFCIPFFLLDLVAVEQFHQCERQ